MIIPKCLDDCKKPVLRIIKIIIENKQIRCEILNLQIINRIIGAALKIVSTNTWELGFAWNCVEYLEDLSLDDKGRKQICSNPNIVTMFARSLDHIEKEYSRYDCLYSLMANTMFN